MFASLYTKSVILWRNGIKEVKLVLYFQVESNHFDYPHSKPEKSVHHFKHIRNTVCVQKNMSYTAFHLLLLIVIIDARQEECYLIFGSATST